MDALLFATYTAGREKQSAVWMTQLETIKRLEQIVNEDQTEALKLRSAIMELQHETARLIVNHRLIMIDYLRWHEVRLD